MKKIIIFILTMLTLLSGFLIFQIMNKELSKEEFIALINSFEQVSNVKIECRATTNNFGEMKDIEIKYIKDEYSLSIREDGLYTWANSKTSECISYFPEEKIYTFVDYVGADSNDWEKTEYTFIRI